MATNILMVDHEGGNHDLALSPGGNLPAFSGPLTGPGSPLDLARVITGNGPEATFSVQPTTAGKLLCVVDITPKQTGLVLVSANFGIVANAADAPGIAMFWEENLTAVGGGTLIEPGLTVQNAGTLTTTPDVVATGTEVFAVSGPTAVILAENVVNLAFAGVPIKLTAGVRACIGFFGTSDAAETSWTVGLALSVVEQVMS